MNGSLVGCRVREAWPSVCAQSWAPAASDAERHQLIGPTHLVVRASSGRVTRSRSAGASEQQRLKLRRAILERDSRTERGETAEDFLARLALAWNVLFPTKAQRSVAEIAKARLRMVLYSDRMEACPQLRRELCSNIVSTMSEYVVVNTHEEVEFDVHRAPEVGTVYTVNVPVARVKSTYQP